MQYEIVDCSDMNFQLDSKAHTIIQHIKSDQFSRSVNYIVHMKSKFKRPQTHFITDCVNKWKDELWLFLEMRWIPDLLRSQLSSMEQWRKAFSNPYKYGFPTVIIIFQ